MQFQRNSTPTAPSDELTKAQQNVDRLARALATAERESADARIAYDRALQAYVADKVGDEPSMEPQREAVGRVESLRRLLDAARQNLTRVTTETEAAVRLATIKASGSRVAELVGAAEAKLVAFQTAVEAVRQAEADLFTALFDSQAGLKQGCGVAQKDADFARGRIRNQVIQIARQGPCRVDARFETDGELHLGQLEQAFFAAQ